MKYFLFYLLSFLSLTAAAQTTSAPQGCRRGVLRPSDPSRNRAEGTQKQLGGDYYVGNRHQLTVLVAFDDRGFVDGESATLSQWDKMLNQENFTEEPFTGSVHDYFRAQSYGRFLLTFDLQYVQLREPMSKYKSTKLYDENSQFLIQDVVAALSDRDIDWSLYDWNDDGYVNQLLIIYAGKGSAWGGFGGGYDAIWPHQWWLSNHINPVTGVFCEPLSVTTGTSRYLVDCYCTVQELSSNGTYGTFGTICHEFSHCFGFPDFYYSGSLVGNWDLMDCGNENGGGFCPPGYSSHERWVMGWLTPVELKTATTVTAMPALDSEPKAYIIRNDGYPDEYYLIENRQQQQWDASLPGSGIVVFHVDFDEEVWLTDFPNKQTKRYTIIPANNYFEYSSVNAKNWSYPYNGNNQLTNESKPAAKLLHANTDGTMLMSKPVTNMAVSGGLASFGFANDVTAVAGVGACINSAAAIYDMQGTALGSSLDALPRGTYIVRLADGTTRKVVKQ